MKFLKALGSAIWNQIAIWLAIPLTFLEGSFLLTAVNEDWLLFAFVALFFVNAMAIGLLGPKIVKFFRK